MVIGPMYVNLREAARLVDMSERRVLRFLSYGRIKGAQRVDGRWRVPVPVEFVSGDDAARKQEAQCDDRGWESLNYGVGDAPMSDRADERLKLTLELLPEEFGELLGAAQRAGVSVQDFVLAAALDRAGEDEH